MNKVFLSSVLSIFLSLFFVLDARRSSDDSAIDFVENSAQVVQPSVKVRVLLDEKQTNQFDYWQIGSEQGLVVIDRDDENNRLFSQKVQVFHRKGGLEVIDTKRQTLRAAQVLKIQPKDGYVRFDKTWYKGSMFVIKDSDRLLLINSLGLEDYVLSVLKSEAFPGWPDQAYRVMAVACRSYVLAQMAQAQKQKRWFHIRNTNVHQCYRGHHEDEKLKQAVDDTHHLVLMHREQPVLAMYDTCCGGAVPAQRADVDFKKAPYLARKDPCTFCRSSKSYHWSAAKTAEQLERLLKREIPHIKKLKHLWVARKDRAGRVERIGINASSGTHYLTGKKFTSLCKGMARSLHFTVKRRAQHIVFNGRGYGHQLGLCQWGAKHLAASGWDFKKILSFYYPGTSLSIMA